MASRIPLTHLHLYIGLFLLFTMPVPSAWASVNVETLAIATADETEISVEVYHSHSDTILIWLPHELGIQTIDKNLARQLAGNGVEVWLTDLLEAYFLPNTISNMDRLPGAAFAALINAANKTGKKIVVAASGRAAIPLLRGVRQWQLGQSTADHLIGAILVSPKLFIKTPEPGLAGKFMPIVAASNLPIVILQPDKSPWFWKLGRSIATLQKGGSDVFVWPIKGVRDRFYFRADADDYEKQVTGRFYTQLLTASKLLGRLPQANRPAANLTETTPVAISTKKETRLEIYKGNPDPAPLVLPDLQGQPFDLRSLLGQVVLVNFWASWCPPCVHEMPSMQRLADHFQADNSQGRPFTIVGVNMAEDKARVQQFLRTKVSISFPIILDVNGEALKDWQVFAFPSSYVLDKKGKIRYALFGGVDWDSPDIKHKISQLLIE